MKKNAVVFVAFIFILMLESDLVGVMVIPQKPASVTLCHMQAKLVMRSSLIMIA